jgi:predicted acetyltransferase
VDYGHWMQKFLLERCTLDSIYDSQAIRSFSGADVNTVISVIFPEKQISDYVVKFVDLKSSFGDFAYHENINVIQKSTKTIANNSYRAFCVTRSQLVKNGSNSSSTDETTTVNNEGFVGDKWGSKYLRSPDIYHKLVLDNPTKFLNLSDLAEVKFGAKTGVNEFFILDDATIKHWGIEKKFLKPILRSVKEVDTYFVEKTQLTGSLFFCNYSKKEIKGTNAFKYIEWGETQCTKKGVPWADVESVQGRNNWYSIGAEILKNADILSNRFIDSRFFFIEAGDFSVADTFFIVKFKNSSDRELLIALMNSSLIYLFTEIYGRKNLGEGLLTIYGPELKQLPIPDPRQFTEKARIGILKSYNELRINSIQDIFSELGFDSLNGTVSPHGDRLEFDLRVMKALGYEGEELSEIYNSLVHLVRQRKSKAQSF